tara:strand:+ start:2244 stop:2465 length:222 start_codon:yes stop_codon:yes gene_type:complete
LIYNNNLLRGTPGTPLLPPGHFFLFRGLDNLYSIIFRGLGRIKKKENSGPWGGYSYPLKAHKRPYNDLGAWGG